MGGRESFPGLSSRCTEKTRLWAQRGHSPPSSLGTDQQYDLNSCGLSLPICKWERISQLDERTHGGKAPSGPWTCTLAVNESSSINPAQGPPCFPHPFTGVENCLLFVFPPDLSGFLTIYVCVCILVTSGQLLMHIQIPEVRIENDSNVCCTV